MSVSTLPAGVFATRLCTGLSASAFLFFALSLALPSGYSYGAVAFLVCAIGGCRALRWIALPAGTTALIGIVMAMGVLWGLSFDGWGALTHSDLWAKYWLAAGVLAVVSVWGVRPQAVEWGLAAGGVGALLVAAYQYVVLGWDKAWGHTNAIQFGGLAMYLGIAAWSVALLGGKQNRERWLLWVCGACAVLASLLSETRGAWVIAPILLSGLLVVLLQQRRYRIALAAVASVGILAAAVWIPYGDKFEARSKLAVTELQAYLDNPAQATETSIGQRLEQWRVALHMVQQKPWTGWGTEGVIQGKQALVDAGWAHASIMGYGHAHNEIIDMLAKRGLLGVLLLLLFYAIPLYLFWPTAKRLARVPNDERMRALGLRLAAAMLPIAYFGYGWTQVFFAHNSGNLFYLFSLVAFWGALQRLEGQTLKA